MRTELCTPQRVSKLKEVLTHHPGTSEVHLSLVNGSRTTVLQAGRRAAGDAQLGADGRPEGAARAGLPGLTERVA